MTTDQSRAAVSVGPATDADRFLADRPTVWFQEVMADPAEEQLVGLAPEHRFAAQVDGADETTYPGVYGVFPMTLSVPGPEAGCARCPARA